MSKLPQAAPIPDRPPLQIKGGNLLVVSPEDIMEACFCVPAVRALSHGRPQSKLVVLTPASHTPLWETVSGIDTLLPYPDQGSVKQIVATLRDCHLELESSFAWEDSAAAQAVAKSRVRQRIGYDLKPLHKRLTDCLPVDPQAGPVEHRVRYYLGLLEKLGIECYVARNFETPPLPPRTAPVRIGLVPGSNLGVSYRWSVDRFGELGQAILERYPVELVILAYPGLTAGASELDSRLEGRARNYAEQFDLAQLLVALPHCDFLIANDGAVTHLAAHLGVPTLTLFGPGDPVASRPLGRQHLVLSQHVECSPCNQSRCPLFHHRCMDELSVERVLEAIPALLPARQANPAPAPATTPTPAS